MDSVPIFTFGTAPESASGDAAPDPEAMGAKGAGLVEMSRLGLPVPPGFLLGTQLGRQLANDEAQLPDEVWQAAADALSQLETATGRNFGGTEKPLLLSVRSGAAASMPGMMDTVLDLGLNGETVEALASETGDARFAWDSYRRFIASFAVVVLGLDDEAFEDALDAARETHGAQTDSDLPAEAVKALSGRFLDIVGEETQSEFPQDVGEQLRLALMAVFKSWNTRRARDFRQMNNIGHDGGTAAIVQTMVFGNRDEHSCSGVYFTRNPSTGAATPYGEYMPNAQGEDVVSGVRTPMELTEKSRLDAMSDNPSMEMLLPDAYAQLLQTGAKLEAHFSDMQEIEFTVESGRLYLLQTRAAKRNPKAALRVAVEMVEEDLISKEEAVSRCSQEMLAPMLVARAETEGATAFAKGLPASPGAVSGEIALTSKRAIEIAEAGKRAILVRPETDPRDVHGMNAAAGILTSRGGMTSHAAVVARGMGKPCITAAMALKIDAAVNTCTASGKTLQEGDTITIDGGTGMAWIGDLPVVEPQPLGNLAKLLEWKAGK